jgi:hypothetical protein
MILNGRASQRKSLAALTKEERGLFISFMILFGSAYRTTGRCPGTGQQSRTSGG